MGTFNLTLKEAIEYHPNIGLDVYPIFDEAYREKLNEKIINHFWNREIGQETVSLFTQRLRNRLANIMPLYNAIYKAQAQAIDPFITFRSTTTSEQENVSKETAKETSDSSQGNKTDSKSRAVNSSFPQQALSSYGDYATDGADSVSHGEGEANATSKGDRSSEGESSGSITSTTEGFSGGSMADLLVNYADAFINTDVLILNELENLFMLVWDTGDSFTTGHWTDWYGGYI